MKEKSVLKEKQTEKQVLTERQNKSKEKHLKIGEGTPANTEYFESVKNYTYEQASRELDEIISKLENGNLNLEDSINLYEKGALLIEHCNSIIGKTTGSITIIKDKIEKSFSSKNKPNENEDF